MAGTGALAWFVGGLLSLAAIAPQVDELVDPPPVAASGTIIPRAPDGQFYADIQINGQPIRALIDEGAEHLLLTGEDAARLGIAPGGGFAPVTLSSVAVGPIARKTVPAMVAPDLPVSLLGRSYLARLDVTVERDRMILR